MFESVVYAVIALGDKTLLGVSKKEGTPTFHDSMDGTGEHYAK